MRYQHKQITKYPRSGTAIPIVNTVSYSELPHAARLLSLLSSLIRTTCSIIFPTQQINVKASRESLLDGCGRCPGTWELASVLLSLGSELWHLPAPSAQAPACEGPQTQRPVSTGGGPHRAGPLRRPTALKRTEALTERTDS